MLTNLHAKFNENPLGASATLLFLLSAAVVLSALGFEHIGGYKPCPLCLIERYAWYFTLIASVFVFMGSKSKSDGGYLALLLMGVIGVWFLYNAYLAGFHAGVEWKWWAGPTSCTGDQLDKLGGGAGGLLDALTKTKVIRCDIAEFRLFGLSFSGYNFLLSLLAGVIALGTWLMVALRMKNSCPR
ncbi:MAG: disulfide bond formation protein B [bacterium]|nr:disulfide bond formation protein B [bacterium]